MSDRHRSCRKTLYSQVLPKIHVSSHPSLLTSRPNDSLPSSGSSWRTNVLHTHSGNNSVTRMDDSPGSSPGLSPTPEIRAPARRCAEALSRSRVGPTSSLSDRGRPATANAARERSRVQTLRLAFLELQRTLPSVPPDTKLSKLDLLILATTYIAHLTRILQEEGMGEGESMRQANVLHSLKGQGYLHPVKKWPMRSRLYVGASGKFLNNSGQTDRSNQSRPSSSSET